MPAPSDIKRIAHAIDNPFDTPLPRISEYTATEIATLQARLDKQLGPEYISNRSGNGGGKVHYIAGEKVINLANEVFGFNGWSSSIQNVQVDFVDENPHSGKVDLGLSVIVRVTLKDGTFHEDIGYGRIENCKGKGIAFEKAKKEGATDGLKRALRNFGKVLGNCLYDKDYLQKVSKMKVPQGRWSEKDLYRHEAYMPLKEDVSAEQDAAAAARSRMKSDRSAVTRATERSTEYGEDEFGGNLFDEMEMDFSHTDEVQLDNSTAEDDKAANNGQQTPLRAPSNPMHGPQASARPTGQPQSSKGSVPSVQGGNDSMRPPQAMQANGQRPQPQTNRPQGQTGSNAAPPRLPPQPGVNAQPQDTLELPPPGGPVGFVAGRGLMDKSLKPFDPLAESPSIRRTAGVDLSKSAPVKRTDIGQSGPPETNAPGPSDKAAGFVPPRTNFVNPAGDMSRKVGMPMAPQSPMMNRSAYKPPSVKRPAPSDAASRPPLTETTNVPARTDAPSDSKKPKMDLPPQAAVEATKT
ncbi:hypothetical protein CAC42_2123 [Sphaceloma murrayae]|uniref:RAD52 homolog n=1 Tax=Sphaceloma murrayae TaxID=2082308 RepID=A0A2K1QI97_9PEZI|nr:hypothetical protein CAC42_2123 [Sphaceloma murrayae]